MTPRKRRSVTTVLLLTLALGLGGCQSPRATGVLPPTTQQSAWDVCFSPKGGCTDLIVRTLAQARTTVHVQAYSFTSQPIAQALVDAHRRGVAVEAILDKGQRTEDNTQAGLLIQAGVPVLIDAIHAIAHNKTMILDGETVITGSFNFTKSAEEKNAENLLVIRDRVLATRYEQNWQKHKMHSEQYQTSPLNSLR